MVPDRPPAASDDPTPTTTGRRTQKDRREATIARLVDATIETICDVGYARCSLGEICARAGVSRGGLFRHFDRRLDLIVAAASVVAARHLAAFDQQLGDDEAPDLRAVLAVMRDRHRADSNVVWFELLVAARTDPELREALAPITAEFYRAMDDLARRLPLLADLDADRRHVLVSFARSFFDGESIARLVVPEPEAEAERFELLADLAVHTVDPGPAAAR